MKKRNYLLKIYEIEKIKDKVLLKKINDYALTFYSTNLDVFLNPSEKKAQKEKIWQNFINDETIKKNFPEIGGLSFEAAEKIFYLIVGKIMRKI